MAPAIRIVTSAFNIILLIQKTTYPHPIGFRIDTLNYAHVVFDTGHRVVGGIITIVKGHQHGCVMIQAKEIGRTADAFDFVVSELWQPRSLEIFLLAHCGNSIDHQLRIVTVCRKNWMRKPAQLPKINKICCNFWSHSAELYEAENTVMRWLYLKLEC